MYYLEKDRPDFVHLTKSLGLMN